MIFPKNHFLSILQYGLVVKFPHPKFPEKDHFFVIVDASPQKVPPMLTLISSKSNTNKQTYVAIEEGEYDFLTKTSFIDCDTVYDITPDELYVLYAKGLLSIQDCFLHETMTKIKDACYKSPLLEKYYKKRIIKAYNENQDSPD